jgi:hypothetical protein
VVVLGASECVNDLRQLFLEFSGEIPPVKRKKDVEKWTEKHRPLFHNHYGDEERVDIWGGLIQTAAGNCNGLGMPCTNRCGYFSKATRKTC